MKSRVALLAVALVFLAACGSHGAQSTGTDAQGNAQTAGSPGPSPTDNTDFALPTGATVVSAKDWTQTVSASDAQTHAVAQGAGTYSGHDTIAQTSASFADAEAWLHGLVAKPPKDYTVAASGSGVDEARKHAQALGIDFSGFQHTVNGKKQGVIVMVIDPKLLNAKAGTYIGMIGKYKMLPQSLRDPIDAQAKARTGYSISDALDPSTPIGAALGSLSTLTASGDRGIILVDATKN